MCSASRYVPVPLLFVFVSCCRFVRFVFLVCFCRSLCICCICSCLAVLLLLLVLVLLFFVFVCCRVVVFPCGLFVVVACSFACGVSCCVSLQNAIVGAVAFYRSNNGVFLCFGLFVGLLACFLCVCMCLRLWVVCVCAFYRFLHQFTLLCLSVWLCFCCVVCMRRFAASSRPPRPLLIMKTRRSLRFDL